MASCNKYTVGATPVRVANANEHRTRLHIACYDTGGVLLGLDEGMSESKSYLLQDHQRFEFKGEVWAVRPGSSDVTVYVFDE